MPLEPVTLERDGSRHYTPPFFVADVLLYDISVLANQPIEIQIWPDGWGFVCVQKQILRTDPATIAAEAVGPGKRQIDGQRRNYTYWGRLEVRETFPEPSLVFDDPRNSGLVVVL